MLNLRNSIWVFISKSILGYFIITIFFLSSIHCNSQISNKRSFSYFELLGGLGTTHYFGDIGGTNKRIKLFKRFEDFDLYETRFAFLGGMRYQINKSFAFSFNLIPALIAGDDKYSLNRDRNFSFHSIVVDATGQFEYYFLPWSTKIRPYFIVGLDATAWISNNIFVSEEDRQIKLRNTWGSHAGIGFRKEINKYSKYGVNIALHRSASDFIDGYNGTTNIPDMYYYVLFEYSTEITKRSIYNRKGKLRKSGITRKRIKNYTDEDIKKIENNEPNTLTAKDRRIIKRYLRKLERIRKKNSGK